MYGIYFYDHVCGHAILGGYTHCHKEANAYRARSLPSQKPINPQTDLYPTIDQHRYHWPVILERGADDPCAYPDLGFIVLPVDSLPDENPHQTWTFYNIPLQQKLLRWLKRQPVDEMPANTSFTYISTNFSVSIVTGIEEAQHTHFGYLEKLHVYAPLRSFDSRLMYRLTAPFRKCRTVDYYGLLRKEYAAHIVRAEYIRRYLPEVWYSGYSHYDLLVHQTRRNALKLQIKRCRVQTTASRTGQ